MPRTRTTPLPAAVLLAALLLVIAQARVAHAAPLNILLVIADDFGWADMSPNNPGTFYQTPALQRLADSGANLRRGYAASPVCSPTRVSIISGVSPTLDAATEWFGNGPARSERYLSADRINELPNHRATVAERLRTAGYQTFFAGKWHLGGSPRHLPQARGFDVNVAGNRQGNPGGWNGTGGYFAPYADFINLDAPDGEHLPVRLTDETIRWITERDPNRPFLAVLSYYSVHTPLQGRDDLVRRYAARRDALGHSDDTRFAPEEQVWETDQPRLDRVVQDHAVYAAMVEAMDEQIGRLLDALDNQGLAGSTLVVFVSDNGGLSTSEGAPTANTPLRAGKGWLYEGGIRVPFIVRWPGVTEPGSTVATPAHTSDIVPTILEAARFPADADPYPRRDLEGRSLRRDLRGDAPDRALVFHYPHYANQGGFPGGAIIRGDDKLILRYADGRHHLFDLAEDTGERTDLAGSSPATARALRDELISRLRGARFLNRRGEGPFPWSPADE